MTIYCVLVLIRYCVTHSYYAHRCAFDAGTAFGQRFGTVHYCISQALIINEMCACATISPFMFNTTLRPKRNVSTYVNLFCDDGRFI